MFCLLCSRSLSVSSAEQELVMDVEPTVCLSPADVAVICVAPKKKARAPGYIWTDEETGFFLSLMQGGETIGYFNRMKLKLKKKKKMPRTKAMKEIAGLMRAKGFQRDSSQLLRFHRHFSPWLFETSGRCHSIMPSLFIPFIHC